MRTMLDAGYTWFLRDLVYRNGELQIVLAEGLRAEEPEDVRVCGILLKNTYKVGVPEDSRCVLVRFQRPVAWQLVVEQFTKLDVYEQREDDGALQVLVRSKYFDYMQANHGWFADIIGPAKHYRVWTENEVIDVVACEPPVVEPAT